MQPSKVKKLTHLWKDRNTWIASLLPEDSSILDIGCGSKSILNYVYCEDYLGLDLTDQADIKTDLNTETVHIDKVYDIGLILGVLEYVNDPLEVIEKYKHNANTWYILVLAKKKKERYGWQHSFNESFLEYVCKKNFDSVTVARNKNYLLGICRNV